MSGPTAAEVRTARARRRSDTFALFGEVLWTGVLVTVVSLPVVSLPAALAAGSRHLRRHIDGRDDGIRLFFGEFRAALLPGGLGGGIVLAVVGVALVLQPTVAIEAGVPGADVLPFVAAAILGALGTLSAAAAAVWRPGRPWRAAIIEGAGRCVAQPRAAALLALAVGLTAVVTWQLPPLLIPGLGCLAFAMTVVGGRGNGAGRAPGARP